MSLRTFALLLLPVALAAQNPYSGNAKEIDVGRGLFRILCAPCHGIQAKGGRGPDLTLGIFANGETDADLFRVIGDGVAGTEMPGYEARYGTDNVWRLIAYIRSVSNRNEKGVAGDAANGAKLFWGKSGCGNCHRVSERGGIAGPELTRIGRKRSIAYLKESMLKPNADLTLGYYKITATLPDGKKTTGVQRNFDNFSCQFVTLEGTMHSLDRQRTSCEREFASIMPAYDKLSAGELDDLAAYMFSLRGEVTR